LTCFFRFIEIKLDTPYFPEVSKKSFGIFGGKFILFLQLVQSLALNQWMNAPELTTEHADAAAPASGAVHARGRLTVTININHCTVRILEHRLASYRTKPDASLSTRFSQVLVQSPNIVQTTAVGLYLVTRAL